MVSSRRLIALQAVGASLSYTSQQTLGWRQREFGGIRLGNVSHSSSPDAISRHQVAASSSTDGSGGAGRQQHLATLSTFLRSRCLLSDDGVSDGALVSVPLQTDSGAAHQWLRAGHLVTSHQTRLPPDLHTQARATGHRLDIIAEKQFHTSQQSRNREPSVITALDLIADEGLQGASSLPASSRSYAIISPSLSTHAP